MTSSNHQLPPLFIVGVGRSGTTLLRAILNAGGHYHIPYECEFIARAYPLYRHATKLSSKEYENLASQFMATSEKRGWGMRRDYIVQQLNEKKPQTFPEVNEVIYRAFLEQTGATHAQWGIKTPYLVDSLDAIFDTFPQAKIIHLVRDGRDVYLSYLNVHRTYKRTFGPSNLLTAAYYWVQGLRRIEQFDSPAIYEIKYEDLLTNPQAEIGKLCTFVGLEYNPRMHEDFHESKWNQNAILAHNEGIHRKLRGKLDPANCGKYLSSMPPIERLLFELIAGRYLDKYRYPLEFGFLGNSAYYLNLPMYAIARLYRDWHNERKNRRLLTTSRKVHRRAS